MSKKRFFLITALTIFMGLIIVQVSHARTINNFNITVGSFGGTQYGGGVASKATANIDGVINASGGVGADRTLDARVERVSDSSGGTYRSFTSYERIRLPNTIGRNSETRLRLRNGTFATVRVQASGTWSPDHQ